MLNRIISQLDQLLFVKEEADYDWKKPTASMLFLMVLGGCFDVVQNAQGQESDFVAVDLCATCFTYLESRKRTWDGPVDIYLNIKDMPPWLSTTKVENSIRRNVRYINIYAEVPFSYEGQTNIALIDSYVSSRRNTIIVGFTDINFLGKAYIWWNWHGDQKINYGEIQLNETIPGRCLDGILLHELFHTLYLDHNTESRHSIMAVPYRSCEYQSIIRLEDIEALQSLYPPKPNRQGVIVNVSSDGNSDFIERYDPAATLITEDKSIQFRSTIEGNEVTEIVAND